MRRIFGNRYEVIKKIGEGGMGVVYKVKDTKLNRIVALKVIKREYVLEVNEIKRFSREVESLKLLKHENIVKIYSYGREGRELFFTMEYIEGKNLKDCLKSGIEFSNIYGFLCNLCDAVDYIHKAGIYHRDLKLSNIMICDKTKSLKLMDFGTAKMIGDATFTETGCMVGTLHYMSPEQINNEKMSSADDVYSIGVIMYELLTGKLPFTGSAANIIAGKVTREPVKPREIKVGIPSELEKICVKAISKNWKYRYRRAEDLKRSILRISSDVKNNKSERFINKKDVVEGKMRDFEKIKISGFDDVSTWKKVLVFSVEFVFILCFYVFQMEFFLFLAVVGCCWLLAFDRGDLIIGEGSHLLEK